MNESPAALPGKGSLVEIDSLEGAKFVVGTVLKGGMGVVLQLVPIRPEWPAVALKTLQTNASLAQFEKEARIWVSVSDHPNIAEVLWYGVFRSRPSVLSPWYQTSLAGGIGSRLSNESLSLVVRGVIDALAYANQKAHVIHCDIKPANILLDASGEARLADFGIASLAEPSSIPLKTVRDVKLGMNKSVNLRGVGGTPLYMAPELFEGAPPSISTDIYAFGVTVYELLTGEHPYLDFASGTGFGDLRTAPLSAALGRRGMGIEPLLRLVVLATQLAPQERPSSYEALLKRAGLQPRAARVPHPDPGSFVRSSLVLREQGKGQESVAELERALARFPGDPLIHNQLGSGLLRVGRPEEARSHLLAATVELVRSNGRYLDKPYVDPIINLGLCFLDLRSFDVAEKNFGLAASLLSGLTPGEQLITRTAFPEFGWLYLYRGEFCEAVEHILTVLRFRGPNSRYRSWAVLAAFLAGTPEKWAADLTILFRPEEDFDLGDAVCIVLLAFLSDRERGRSLLKLLTTDLKERIAAVERETGVPIFPGQGVLSTSARSLLLRSLDHSITGGKHDGLIG